MLEIQILAIIRAHIGAGCAIRRGDLLQMLKLRGYQVDDRKMRMMIENLRTSVSGGAWICSTRNGTGYFYAETEKELEDFLHTENNRGGVDHQQGETASQESQPNIGRAIRYSNTGGIMSDSIHFTLRPGDQVIVEIEGREGLVFVGHPVVGTPFATVNLTNDPDDAEGFLFEHVKVVEKIIDLPEISPTPTLPKNPSEYLEREKDTPTKSGHYSRKNKRG